MTFGERLTELRKENGYNTWLKDYSIDSMCSKLKTIYDESGVVTSEKI